MPKLKKEFYLREDVVPIARDLLGKVLITNMDGKISGGMIVETEAYSWRERGCHAFNNRRTARTETMFAEGGCAYVYLCYGVHHLFNVVTNQRGIAEAVLIRALQPERGQAQMLQRMGVGTASRITSGPGKLTRALGIETAHTGTRLMGREIWLEDVGHRVAPGEIATAKRIGIDYAGADALLPWRFTIAGNEWISKK
jgi:DNA-3-methyladenine glycosylase